jgi:hypothetical protein
MSRAGRLARMNDDLYFEFEMQWLGKWRKGRYTATRAQLEDRYPGAYRIISEGIRRTSPYGADGNMYAPWGHGMVWEKSIAPRDDDDERK